MSQRAKDAVAAQTAQGVIPRFALQRSPTTLLAMGFEPLDSLGEASVDWSAGDRARSDVSSPPPHGGE